MLVSLKDTYYVNSNRESGLGRYDIMLEPKDKQYKASLKERGFTNITKMVFAFNGKDVKLETY